MIFRPFSIGSKGEGPLFIGGSSGVCLGRLGRCWAGTSSPEATATSGSVTRLGDVIVGSGRAGLKQESAERRGDCWVMSDSATGGL